MNEGKGSNKEEEEKHRPVHCSTLAAPSEHLTLLHSNTTRLLHDKVHNTLPTSLTSLVHQGSAIHYFM
ncbi:hypothetical protein E2C01_092565 [Portunus trituberculatus]|uniref:Uncharacterized protein n=1 Tax=Portunus trituberculatus TaxID=210409 RepID=A0A5B7JGS9_PORTR|nr:hypothetical protein [Portunus trituberculatus]